MTMIYYALNDNKPLLCKDKTKIVQVIHYCPNCETLICGEWDTHKIDATEEKDKGKVWGHFEYSIGNFANMKNCPVCEGKFHNNINHHFIYNESRKVLSTHIRRCILEFEDLCYRYVFEDSLKELGIHDKYNELQEGKKILTDFGPATVVQKPGYQIGIKYDCVCKDTVKSISSFLNNYYSKERNQRVEKKIKTFIYNCTADDKDTTISTFQKNDDFKLKEYLEQLVLIEKNIFSLTQRLRKLYYLNATAEKDAQTSEKLMVLSNVNSVKDALNSYETLKRKNVENEIKITDFTIKYPKEPKKPKKPEEPVLAQPGFFNKKRVLAENAVLTEKYEKELETYNLALEKYESDFKKYNETKSLLEKQRDESYKSAVENAKSNLEKEIAKAQAKYNELLSKQQEAENNASDIPTPEKAQYQFLKDEIEIAEELLKNFYKARNEMYSYGVIFEKYRDFVAISSFYEYISSGRCETLEGPNGAYNLYENEIRMNTVIEKLNNVIESLEEIKQNQFMIYSAIQESNRHLKTLNSTTTQMLGALGELNEKATSMESYMSKIAYNTKVTAYNTEKTAFYAKKNAELTNALGFLVALK